MWINKNRLTDREGCVIARSVSDEAICFLFLLCVLVFSPKFAFAAASVSVNVNDWAIGTKAALSESTSTANQWTVTNNDSGGTEDVLIKVTSSGLWTASTDATLTNNEFLLRKNNSAGQIITGTGTDVLVTGLANNATNSFGLYFKAPIAGSEQGAHSLTVTLTATNWVFVCGNNLTVTHTAGDVAAVDKTVSYGTVSSTLGGTGAKCWITRNLGADNQAGSATNNSSASAGWYWQFNRKQGYEYDDLGFRVPSTAWTSSDDNTYSGWDPAKDPCTLLLGTGWRLPTNAEWTNADGVSGGNWANYTDTYNSVLKLHAAGYLFFSNGALNLRGSDGFYWSSTQGSSTNGYYLNFGSSYSYMNYVNKAYGFSVRCLKD